MIDTSFTIPTSESHIRGIKMNKPLARMHVGFIIFNGLMTVASCAWHLAGDKASALGVAILAAIFGTPVVLHYLALRGVRTGRRWGRTLSRVLGVLLLFAAPPIGTILGASMLMRTGKVDWQSGPE
jgi:hypothetical protein